VAKVDVLSRIKFQNSCGETNENIADETRK
jgi:hypothetical protein